MRIGPYEVLGELGRGGMGAVLRARDPRSGREVAIKVLHARRATNARARERFLREARVLQRLEHRHLVPILEAREDGEAPCIVMPLIAGETLGERVRTAGPLAPLEAARLVAKLADALAHAHAQGVLHRDVKPSNVLLDGDGEPWLTDFGLARELTPAEHAKLTQTGQFLGTPGFWAPEQAAGQLDAIGPATDVYGLGATLYHALTGAPPLDGATLQEQMLATAARTPTAPSALNPDVPAWLSAVCLRCLEKAPADRYPTPADLADALLPPAPASRRPLLLGAVGLLLLGGGAAALAVTRSPDPSPSPASAASTITPPDPFAAASPAPSPSPDASTSTAPPEDPALSALLRQAGHLGRLNKLTELEALLTRALPEHPREVELWLRRGHVRVALGRPREAIADFEHGLTLEPKHPVLYLGRARAYLRLKDAARAEQDLKTALRLKPRDPSALRLLVGQLVQARRDRDALPYLDRLHAVAPEDASVLAARGQARGNLGDPRGAIADYRASVKLDPSSAKAWYNLGNLLARSGEPTQAAEAYTRAIALGHAGSLFNRGNAYHLASRPSDAIADYTRCLERLGDDVRVLSNRGLCYLDLGKHTEALRDMTRAVELRRTAQFLINRGRILQELKGREADALADYTEAIRLDAKNFRGFWRRGALRLRLGEPQEALADLTRALRSGGEILAVADAARAYQAAGQPEQARALLRRSIGAMKPYRARKRKKPDTESNRQSLAHTGELLRSWEALAKELAE